MIQRITKSEQFNDVIFGGRFYANKPVFQGHAATATFGNLYYWSNGYVQEAVEFGLHPHKGFEIMTFLWEGSIEHYDTQSRVWTPLHAGDFQIIQSNKGISHQERIAAGSRAFQIWFDPNMQRTLQLPPTYTDYAAQNFAPQLKDGIATITYVGEGSSTTTATPGIEIKQFILEDGQRATLQLDPEKIYLFYVLSGNGIVGGEALHTDDALRLMDESLVDLDFKGRLFYIATPKEVGYETEF